MASVVCGIREKSFVLYFKRFCSEKSGYGLEFI